jgi:hypothetical protein
VLVPAGHISTNCPFCGTPQVIESGEQQDLIEPTAFLPFKLSAADALAAVTHWLGGQHFAPEKLQVRSTQMTPRPIYLPFWTFDMVGEVRWEGHEVVPEYTHTRRVPANGTIPLLVQDMAVPGSKSVSSDILERIEFDSHSLLPYTPDALANWPAEIYSISAADASIDARGKVLDNARANHSVMNNANVVATVEDVVVSGSDLSITSYKLVLVPIWVGSYQFDGQLYQVVANGNSGQVEGNIPRSAFQNALTHLFGKMFAG